MKNHVKCNVCGYIMHKSKVKDVCPACGVLAQNFQPYESKLSGRREAFLSLHLHPVIVHLPMTLVFLALLFDIAALLFIGASYDILAAGVKINTVLLPIGVLAAALTGILDGRMRFKRLSTKKLKFKMLASIIFFAIAVTEALIAMLVPLSAGALIVLIVLTCAALIPAALLGNAGSKLIVAVMPG